MNKRRLLCALLLAALLTGLAVPARALEKGRLLRVANCGEWAAMRWYADADAERVAKLPRGALVVYGGVSRNGYRLVRYGKKEGFVGVGFLKKQNRALRVNRSTWMWDDDGRKLKKLRKGTVLVAMSAAKEGRFRVYCGGQGGYVDSTALRAASPKHGRRAVTAKALALREGPGSKRVATLPRYAGVYCFGSDGDGHEYVCCSGKYGFVSQSGLLYWE